MVFQSILFKNDNMTIEKTAKINRCSKLLGAAATPADIRYINFINITEWALSTWNGLDEEKLICFLFQYDHEKLNILQEFNTVLDQEILTVFQYLPIW